MERQKESSFVLQSNALSCNKLYVSGFENDNCGYPNTPNSTIPKHLTMAIKDTARVLMPLIWLSSLAPSVQIKSFLYFRPTTENITNYKLIQFMFYNKQYQNRGVAYLTLSQSSYKCVTFYSNNIVSYDKVTMLMPFSAVLLKSVSTAALVSHS
jgi:hypothetical protein